MLPNDIIHNENCGYVSDSINAELQRQRTHSLRKDVVIQPLNCVSELQSEDERNEAIPPIEGSPNAEAMSQRRLDIVGRT
jgi:hypothetical protein